MSDTITLTGVVATAPRALTTQEGLAITSFRLASTQRRFDRAQERWVDGDTNWYTITSFRQLAANAALSVVKGARVIVTGRLRIRDWETNGRAGTNIDVEADAIGHDLSWGTAAFSRSVASASVETLAANAAVQGGSPATASASSDEQGFPSEADAAPGDDDMVTPF